MNYVKIYVRTVCEFFVDGGIKPLYIEWTDGKVFTIDRVKLVERKPCKSGGVLPRRYTVVIGGKQRYLYYEREKERWFVEKEGV